MTGHLLGGAGGLEAGITILAMLNQIAPPTMNLDQVDPVCRLNYVPNKPQAAKIDYALSNSFGFGAPTAPSSSAAGRNSLRRFIEERVLQNDRVLWPGANPPPPPAQTEKPPAFRRESLLLLEANGCYIETPPPAFCSFFNSFALRAPMALLLHRSTCAISALRAASLPHSRSALRRYVSWMYCMASS